MTLKTSMSFVVSLALVVVSAFGLAACTGGGGGGYDNGGGSSPPPVRRGS